MKAFNLTFISIITCFHALGKSRPYNITKDKPKDKTNRTIEQNNGG